MPRWLPKRSRPYLPSPRMTPSILASKRHHRYLERIWRRNQTVLHRSRLTRQTHLCGRKMSKARSATISKSLLSTLVIIFHYGRHLSKSYTTALKCTFVILHRSSGEHIQLFFHAGVESSWYQERLTEPSLCHWWWSCHHVLLAPCKSSDLDPIPTCLVNDCIDIIITTMPSINQLPSLHASRLLPSPPLWKIRIICKIASLVSPPRFFRKLWWTI